MRATNLPQFNVDLDKFARNLRIDTVTLVKKVGFDLFSSIVRRTPVDTGWARANWFMTVSFPDYTSQPAGPRQAYKGGGGGAQAQATARANRTIGEYQSLESLWIQNNTPYIAMLESGSSQQAPSGMVAVTLLEFARMVRRAERG